MIEIYSYFPITTVQFKISHFSSITMVIITKIHIKQSLYRVLYLYYSQGFLKNTSIITNANDYVKHIVGSQRTEKANFYKKIKRTKTTSNSKPFHSSFITTTSTAQQWKKFLQNFFDRKLSQKPLPSFSNISREYTIA
jgi:hypothetical protein